MPVRPSCTDFDRSPSLRRGDRLEQQAIEAIRCPRKRSSALQLINCSKEYQETEVRNILEAMNNILEEEVVLRGPSATNEFFYASTEWSARTWVSISTPSPVGFAKTKGSSAPIDALTLAMCPDSSVAAARGAHESGDQDLVAAVVAMVTRTWSHPFGDGNGQTGWLSSTSCCRRRASRISRRMCTSAERVLPRPGEREQHRRLDQFIAYAARVSEQPLILETIQDSQFAIAWRSYIHEKLAETHFKGTS